MSLDDWLGYIEGNGVLVDKVWCSFMSLTNMCECLMDDGYQKANMCSLFFMYIIINSQL